MSPGFLSFHLFLLSSFSLLVPLTTALPTPSTKPTPEFNTCLTFASPLKIASLKLSNGATCAFYDVPGCSSEPLATCFSATIQPQLQHKIASVNCESSEVAVEEGSEQRGLRDDLRRSTSIAVQRRNTEAADAPPQPYAETTQASAGDVTLTPWKPPANSWPPKQSDGCGGDGPYYANGNGCIGPGKRERHVDDLDE